VVQIKTLGKSRIDLKSLQGISLLGSPDKLKFSQDAESLRITLPSKAPYECSAYPLKLVFSGQIPKLKPAPKLLWQAQARDIEGAEDRSTYGLPAECGVLMLGVPAGSDAARAGLKKGHQHPPQCGPSAGQLSLARLGGLAHHGRDRRTEHDL
jgi:hypothetical protein